MSDSGQVLLSLVLSPAESLDVPEEAVEHTRRSVELQGPGPWELVEDAAEARGRWVARVHVGDQLEPGALAAVAAYLVERGWVDGDATDLPGALFTDEQWPAQGAAGIAAKPDFSLRLLRQYDALGRLLFVREDLLPDLDGRDLPDPAVRRAAAWDRHLRLAELTERRGLSIAHVPVLGVWRPVAPPRTRATQEAGLAAVRAHLRRCGVEARAELDGQGRVRVTHAVPERAGEPPLVSLVIPTGGGRRRVRGRDTLLVEHTVSSVADRTGYQNYEVVLVTSQGTDPAVVDAARGALDRAGAPAPLRTVAAEGPFNFSESINLGVQEARGEFVLLLNDDVEVISTDWLDRMVAVAHEEGVGAVGAKLLFEDGRIQHVGVYLKNDGWVGHQHIFEPDVPGPFGEKVVDADVLAVTGACLLLRREVFAEVGGMTPSLPLNFNDVDLCLKLVAAGYTNVVTPAAMLYHFESSTRTPEVLDAETDALDWWRPLSLREPNVQIRGIV